MAKITLYLPEEDAQKLYWKLHKGLKAVGIKEPSGRVEIESEEYTGGRALNL